MTFNYTLVRRRHWLGFLWLSMLALTTSLSPGRLRADVNASISTLSVTNYTGYIIASDANVGPDAFNRDHLAVRAQVYFNHEFGGDTNHNVFDYAFHFTLEDQNGVTQPLLVNGKTNTEVVVVQTISRPTFIFINFPVDTIASLTPAGVLDPFNRYHVSVHLWRRVNGSLLRPTDTGLSLSDINQRYIDFASPSASDVPVNVFAELTGANPNQTILINGSPSQSKFSVDVATHVVRYDDWLKPVSSANVTVRYHLQLRDAATQTLVPLAQDTIDLVKNIQNYIPPFGGVTVPRPVEGFLSDTLSFSPAPGTQIDAVNHTYHLTVSIAHLEVTNGSEVPANSVDTSAQRYLQFDGTLHFGDVATTFTHVASAPPIITVDPSGIRTTLSVDSQSGFVIGEPDHTYGDGTALDVWLRSNGDAELASGGVVLTAPSPDSDMAANIKFIRGSTILYTNGAAAQLGVVLPTGAGYGFATTNRVVSDLALFLSYYKLNQSLQPATNPIVNGFGTAYLSEESKPLLIEFNQVTWLVSQGELDFQTTGAAHYVRASEYAALEGYAAFADRKDNSRYYEFVTGVGPQVKLQADQDGKALLTADFKFGPGNFRPHFPYGPALSWSGAGAQAIVKDQVNPSVGGLTGANSFAQGYARDCTEVGCGGTNGPAFITAVPSTAHLSFTRDGGLQTPVDLPTAAPITWGWITGNSDYAVKTSEFDHGSFHMPGSFLRGDQSTQAPEHAPVVLLYTGVIPNNLAHVERFGTGDYQTGGGDYAGLNFRVGTNAMQGASVIAGKPTGFYPIDSFSKYYVRESGVNGIHEATFGQFPKALNLYGYKFTFSNYSLSYLDNKNWDSATDGSVYVPNPSDFTQDFDNLKFTCLGAPGPAKVPASEAGLSKVLSYWAADFIPMTIAFDRPADASCDPSKGVLTMGIQAYAQHVSDNLHGVVGFWPNGNLITLADCKSPSKPLDPPFDSRLKLPNNFTLRGPKNEKYNATPVNDAYLNNWEFDQSGHGYFNVAAKLDVPFFEDLKVHIHTSATKADTNAAVYLMGGWPDKGFGNATHNFFTENPSDISNRGFPDSAGVTPDKYQTGFDGMDDRYRVRAQRTWIDVVHFDYPLKWSSSTRAFQSFEPVKNDLLVLTVEHQVKYLSAANAELKFGAQFELIPQANLANLAFDQLGGLEKKLDGVIQAQVMNAGMNALNELLDAQLHTLLDKALKATVDPIIANLYNQLESNYDHAQKKFMVPPLGLISPLTTGGGINSIVGQLQKIGEGTAAVAGITKEVSDRLGQAIAAIDEVNSFVGDNSADRGKIEDFIKNIAEDVGSLFSSPDFAKQVDDFLKTIDPTFDDLHTILTDLRGVLAQAKADADTGNGFAQELKTKLAAATAEFTSVANQVQTEYTTLFNGYKPGLDDPFKQFTAQDLQAKMRKILEDKLFGSKVADIIHHTIQQQFYDLNASIREAIDSVFAQVNQTLRDLLAQSLSSVSDGFTNMDDGGGQGAPSGVMAAGRIDGYAHIVGDSLSELRLDIKAKLKVPDEMKLNAYLRIRELNSENTAAGCLPPGGKATEVTLGAKDVNLDWISPDMKANVDGKFTFGEVPSIYLAGLGIGFELTGPLKFQTFTITSLGASMGFGLTENYFSGECGVEFNGYKGKGGIFFGKTCSLDAFFWDKDVAQILGTPPFTGAYAYGEIWVPISEALLGIPATCFFEVSAGVGLGAGYFVEGPTFVGKMYLGVSGSVQCIVSVEGDIYLVAVKNPQGLSLKGGGDFTGSLGPCPLCISFSKHVGLLYQHGSWSVDF